MFDKCVECDHILEDEEHIYKGKSYCDDCYRAVKKFEATQQEREHNLLIQRTNEQDCRVGYDIIRYFD